MQKTSGRCSPPPPPSWAQVNFWMRGLLSSGIALCQRYWHVPFLRLCHQAANQGKMSFSSYDVGGPAGGGGASQRWPIRTDSGQTQGRCFRSDTGTLFQVRQAGSFHSGQTGRGWGRVAVRCECGRWTRSVWGSTGFAWILFEFTYALAYSLFSRLQTMRVLVHSDVDVLEPAQDEDENIIYLLRSLLGFPCFLWVSSVPCVCRCRLSVYIAPPARCFAVGLTTPVCTSSTRTSTRRWWWWLPTMAQSGQWAGLTWPDPNWPDLTPFDLTQPGQTRTDMTWSTDLTWSDLAHCDGSPWGNGASQLRSTKCQTSLPYKVGSS